MDLHVEGAKIAATALDSADGLIVRYRMPPQAQVDLLEVILSAIGEHRDHLVGVHGLDSEVDD